MAGNTKGNSESFDQPKVHFTAVVEWNHLLWLTSNKKLWMVHPHLDTCELVDEVSDFLKDGARGEENPPMQLTSSPKYLLVALGLRFALFDGERWTYQEFFG